MTDPKLAIATGLARPGPLVAYPGALLISAVVILLRLSLDPVLAGQAPLLVLLIAPVLAAAWAGFGPGLLATATTAAVGTVLFIAPVEDLLPPQASAVVRILVFVAEGTLFSWLFHERQRATATATRRERRFRDAIEAAPSGMILADGNGRIEFANAAARTLFGYESEEFRQLSIEELVPRELREAHRRDRMAFSRAPTSRGMGIGRELRARRRDGSEFPVEIGLSPVNADDTPRVLAAVVDVSARQRALARLVESERRQRFLLQLTERLQALRDPEEMMDAATRALGEFLGVAQLGYGEIDAPQQHVIIARDWNDGRIPSVVGTWRMGDF